MEYIHFEKVCIEYLISMILNIMLFFILFLMNFTFNIFNQQEGSLCAQHCLNALLQGLGINLDLLNVYFYV